MAEVLWSEAAQADLDEYCDHKTAAGALLLRRRMLDLTEMLEANPTPTNPLAEFRGVRLHWWPTAGYRVYYLYDPGSDIVLIQQVLHSRVLTELRDPLRAYHHEWPPRES